MSALVARSVIRRRRARLPREWSRARIAEGGDARAVERELRGLHEARAVGHLAEVPAFADQLHLAAGGTRSPRAQLFHHRARLMRHPGRSGTSRCRYCVAQVATEFDHQLAICQVLGGGVLAAGQALDAARRRQAGGSSPARCDRAPPLSLCPRPRCGCRPRPCHAQPGTVQRHHHLAELDDAHSAVRPRQA